MAYPARPDGGIVVVQAMSYRELPLILGGQAVCIEARRLGYGDLLDATGSSTRTLTATAMTLPSHAGTLLRMRVTGLFPMLPQQVPAIVVAVGGSHYSMNVIS